MSDKKIYEKRIERLIRDDREKQPVGIESKMNIIYNQVTSCNLTHNEKWV